MHVFSVTIDAGELRWTALVRAANEHDALMQASKSMQQLPEAEGPVIRHLRSCDAC